jgi:ABC-type oligopeptide transport system substrate-binding subunit
VQFVDPDDTYGSLHSGSSTNVLNYSDPAVDAAFEKGRSDPNPADRVAAYDTVQQLVSQDVPFFPLLYDLYANISKNTVHGVPVADPDSLGAIKVTTIWMS